MPIIEGIDGIGPYFRFGQSGVKYHYKPWSQRSKGYAYQNVLKQMRAIEASKHRRNKK